MTLREQVAQALVAAAFSEKGTGGDAVASSSDAAIRVVLAAVTKEIEALPEYVFVEPFGVRLDKESVLAVVARLGEEAA